MKKLKIKTNMLIFISSVMLTVSSAYAGSGAGGQIRFYNDSNKTVSVVFEGLGCFGGYWGDTLVCESYSNVFPGEIKEYKYNWGVTTTWISVATKFHDRWKERSPGVFAFPCKGLPEYKKYCYLNSQQVHSNAYKWSDYHFKG